MNRHIIRSAKNRSRGGTALVVHTGLSRTVAGHLVLVERDNMTRVARIAVKRLKEGINHVTAADMDAVKITANLLAEQAKRTLGMKWVVQQWNGEIDAEKVGAG